MSEINRECQRQEFDESLANFVRFHHTNRTINHNNLTVNANITNVNNNSNINNLNSASNNNNDEVSQVVIHADESEHEDALTPIPFIHSHSFSNNNNNTNTITNTITNNNNNNLNSDTNNSSNSNNNVNISNHHQLLGRNNHSTVLMHSPISTPNQPSIARISSGDHNENNSIIHVDDSSDVTIISPSPLNDSPLQQNIRSPLSAPLTGHSTNLSSNPSTVTTPTSSIVPMSARGSKLPSYYSATMQLPTQSRANSEPAKPRLSSHHSRYSIVGLPRPRRLASESNPSVSATLQSRTISSNTRLPSNSVPGVKSPPHITNNNPSSSHSYPHASVRKSWSVRDMWVNREQQELKIEEEKQKARIKQLTKALNICRLIQPRKEISIEEVENIVKKLKIDLSKLDVGHITTMEHERLLFDSSLILLSVLQLLSTPAMNYEIVQQKLNLLKVSSDVYEYCMFFFPTQGELINNNEIRPSSQSRHDAYNSHRKSLSQAHHPNGINSLSQSPQQSTRDVLTALTSFINRRQTEDRIRSDQLDSYAKQVKFDLAKVNVSDAEAVLGRSFSSIELGSPSATSTNLPAIERKVSLPHLNSANQVVIALQMLYEDVAFEDSQLTEICEKAKMAPDTVKYLLAKNKEKQKRLMDEDRAKRRKKRIQQRNERQTQQNNTNNNNTTNNIINGSTNGLTIKQLCVAINSNHLCLNWANDEDELTAAFKSIPCDLKSINLSMVNELAVNQFKFSSPSQLAHTLHLLSAPDVSIQQIQHLCTETALPPAIVRHIVTARLKFELLDDDAITVAEEEDERQTNESRLQKSKQKAESVMAFELQEDDENNLQTDEMTITAANGANNNNNQPKSVTITELVDSLNSAQLIHSAIMMTPTMVTELLDQHPFPLSILDLSEIHSMRQAQLTFDSPKQLFEALELLHSELQDEEIRIEAGNSDMKPYIVRYIMEHDRPIHAQVNISREDSRASRSKHGKRGLSRHSISLVQTIEGGQEFVEEYIQAASIADFIAGTTTSSQLVAAVKQAHIVDVDNDSFNNSSIETFASELEFDYSVVDLEMIPILARHTSPFKSIPQLLTALQLLYTDLSDDEIKIECEAVKMDRKTSKFLIKNSLRKLLSQPDISAKLSDAGIVEPNEKTNDPRYARVIQVDDGSGMEEMVEMINDNNSNIVDPRKLRNRHKRGKSYFTSSDQLAQLVSQLDLLDKNSSSSSSSVIELSDALRIESVDLNEIKLTDLARFAEHGVKFASITQIVSALNLIHSELNSDEIQFEAKRRNLPEPIISHLMEFHSEDHEDNKIDFQPLSSNDRKQWRSRHQARYISQDLREEDWSEELLSDPLTVNERRRNTAVAVYAKLQSCDSMLESGVSATQAEIELWMSKLNVDSDWIQVEALELVQMQITAGLEHKLMSVRDLIIAVVDAGDQASMIAENEGINIENFIEKVKSGERELPLPTKPSERKLHNRSASMPNSRRTSGYHVNHIPQSLQTIHSNVSASPSPLSSQNRTPSMNDGSGRRLRGHVRGAQSVSWNMQQAREATLESGLVKDKRDTQLNQLRRIIAQNQIIVAATNVNINNVTPTPTPRTSQPINNDEPPPPLLLSERRSLGTAPQSPTSPNSQLPMMLMSGASMTNSPINSVRPPPLPPGYSLRINTHTNAMSQSPSSIINTIAPLTVSELEIAYQWDSIVDPVYSIHLVCDLIKWRAVNDPHLTFPSVTAMFDFLNSPGCPVFDNDDEIDGNNPILMTGGNDVNDNNTIDRSVTQSVKSLASRLAPQIRPQLPSLNVQTQGTAEIDASNSALPPPIPPSAFAPPPFSPTVALSINHPYAFPSIEAMNQAKERQLSLGDGDANGAQPENVTVCCGPSFFGSSRNHQPIPGSPNTANNVNSANHSKSSCVVM